jgi:kynurenine formamidase
MNSQLKTIDLTHAVSGNIPSWDGKPDFDLITTTDYKDCAPPDLFRKYRLQFDMSLGTHSDSPAHVIPGGRTIDQLTLEELVADCVVIDVSQEADESYVVMPSAIENSSKHMAKSQNAPW